MKDTLDKFDTISELMERVNSRPKIKNIVGDILDKKFYPPEGSKIFFNRGAWWIETSPEDFSYFYRSLDELVSAWDIYLNSYDETTKTWGYNCI